ncbi:hypothetical protein ACFW1J_15085 [Priestia aryabhattai]|uniref:hypothetical protein n=1 Tax=Priestia aryabhattai TaxID=412384 RepID=UPI00366E7280
MFKKEHGEIINYFQKYREIYYHYYLMYIQRIRHVSIYTDEEKINQTIITHFGSMNMRSECC